MRIWSGEIFTTRNVWSTPFTQHKIMQSRRLRWAGHVSRMKEDRSCIKVLTDKTTRKKPRGRPKRKWEEYVTINIKEICFNMRNVIDSAQDMDCCRALVKAALINMFFFSNSPNIHSSFLIVFEVSAAEINTSLIRILLCFCFSSRLN